MTTGAQRQGVQRAARAARKIRPVKKNARPIDDPGPPLAVDNGGDAPAGGPKVLPGGRIQPAGGLPNPALIVSPGIESPVRAAAVVRTTGDNSRAPGAENARPARGEPRKVAAEQLLRIRRIDEFHPVAGKIQRHLAGGRRTAHSGFVRGKPYADPDWSAGHAAEPTGPGPAHAPYRRDRRAQAAACRCRATLVTTMRRCGGAPATS